ACRSSPSVPGSKRSPLLSAKCPVVAMLLLPIADSPTSKSSRRRVLSYGIDSVGLVRRSETSPPSLSYSLGKLRSSECCNCGWVNVTWLPSIAPSVLRVEQPAATRATSNNSTSLLDLGTTVPRTAGLRMIDPLQVMSDGHVTQPPT